MTDKLFSEIASCRLFATADPKKLRAALNVGENGEACYEEGETVVSSDDSGRRIGIVISGNVKIRSADEEKNVLLRTMAAGEVFGVANLFDGDARFVSRIVAGRACRIYFVSREAVESLLRSDQAFVFSYIEFLSGRIRFLNRKIMFYTSGSAERRVALYLASFENERVTPDMPMNALAELLDIGRASLYRAIDRLIDDGFVTRDGGDFILRDTEKMLQKYKI